MTILAATDETDRATETVSLAHELATKYDDDLVVLHVIPRENYEKHRETLEAIPEFSDLSIDREAESAARVAQRLAEETVGETDVAIESSGRVGDVADETLAEVAAVDPRYLVLSGRRRSPTGKAVFGSPVQRILLNATCPVVSQMND